MSAQPFKFSYKGAILMILGFSVINAIASLLTSAYALNPILTSVVSNGILCSIWVSFIISKVELKEAFSKQAVFRTVKISLVFTLIAFLWGKGVYL
ncbi:hypothetical protein [Fusibacter sp. 3D3]|uniref:hypothetical protein n=1 Tax=Fusibacter sp. 3D3 TaxID=1048380 RepID=UPI0008528FE8|nr:hypothetical protein [Fusibacter sp. 3D3]GAU75935.1 hypothetical protein F3D3_0531 [Fusibacter sp. 3D3]